MMRPIDDPYYYKKDGDDPLDVEIGFVDVSIGTSYIVTNRGLKDRTFQKGFYPEQWRNWKALQGKKVLDVSSGGGRFVIELREQNVDAIGLDISVPEFLKKHPELNRYFVESDASVMPFPDNSFDVIYSTSGVFNYETKNPAVMLKVLSEIVRVLRPGGSIRINNSSSEDAHSTSVLPQLASQLPNVQLVPILVRTSPQVIVYELTKIK